MATKKENKKIEDLIEDREKIISTAVDEITLERKKLNEMAEKIKKMVGDEYVFLLFPVLSAPRVGDTLEIGDLIATFKKNKQYGKRKI